MENRRYITIRKTYIKGLAYRSILSTYIHQGRIGHRHKLANCKRELLVSCGDNVVQTALK
jgi:hypothetical protein